MEKQGAVITPPTLARYISWESDREGKPRAFPVFCSRLTFKIYCFKMLIILSDISCVTKWIVTAEGETFFLTTFLTVREGWAKPAPRRGDGSSSRRAARAHTLQSAHRDRGGDEGLQRNKPAQFHTKTFYWITHNWSSGTSQPSTDLGPQWWEHRARRYDQREMRSMAARGSELPCCSFTITPSMERETLSVFGDTTAPFRQFQGN